MTTVRSKNAHWHALASTFLGESFDALDASIYFIALVPALSELLGTKDAEAIGWHGAIILAIFMVGWALGSIVFGMLADRIGRVHTMIGSIVLYAVATGLCAASHSWQDLAFCRFFVGLGIGGEMALGFVVVGEAWKGASRPWAMAVMQTSFGVGCLLTGLFNLGSGALGWRYLFLIGLVPAIGTFYIRAKMSESESFSELKLQRKELATKAPADLTSAEKSALANPLKLALNSDNLRNTIICTAIAGSAIVGYWAAISWMPAWINQITGNEAVGERSSATMIMGFGGMLGTLVAPLMLNKIGYRKSFVVSFLGSIIPTMAMFLLVKTYDPWLNVWSFVIGFGSYMPFLLIAVYISEVFATNLLGTASGIAWGVGRIMAAVMGLITGPMIIWFHGSYGNAAACVTLVYFVGLGAALFAREPKENLVKLEI